MKKHRLMNHQKYFRTLCFGLSFLTAACTNESSLNTEPAEWPKTSISIQATVDTKAANEPETAADNGTITRAGGDKQVPAGYRLRCKLEVYSKTTDLRVAQAQLFIDDNSGLTGAITFPDVHLPPNDTYKAICWADYIAAGTETDLIYNTSKGLSDIRLIETIGTVHAETAANEADIEDAYAGQSETFTIEASGAVKEGDEEKLTSIKLRRPFVKLSLPWVKLTTEDGSVWTDALRNIRIVYETGNVLYTQFNAWTGEASGARTVSSALYPQTEERVSCAGGGCLPDDTRVKANGTCIFNGGRWNGGALYPAHETAEISTEGKFSSFLYLYDPDVASHLVPDMAAYGTSADIRVQLDLGGPRIYREVPVPV